MINVAAPGYFKPPKRRTISVDEVRGYAQVIVRDTAQSADKVSLFVIPGARHWKVSDLTTKKELLLAGLGWGRMPVHVISEELESGCLIPIRVEGLPVNTEADMLAIRIVGRAVGPIGARIWQEFTAGQDQS